MVEPFGPQLSRLVNRRLGLLVSTHSNQSIVVVLVSDLFASFFFLRPTTPKPQTTKTQGFFITPIFHPNVAKNGEICVNTLKKDWKSDCKLRSVPLTLLLGEKIMI